MYFNLKEGHTEKELIDHLSEYDEKMKRKVKGWLGFTLYKHYMFGEHRRGYQLWLKFDRLAMFDEEIKHKSDDDIKSMSPSIMDVADMVNHIDEVVCEVYPHWEPPSYPE
jgi:hypothetical protein